MTQTPHLIETIDVGDLLGEGVLWRASDQTVWWTDIEGRRLHRLAWPSLALKTFPTPERLGSFAFVEGSDQLLFCAFETGFAWFTPESGELDWLARPVGLGPGVRLNDGRTDPVGRFWAGSMVEDEPDRAKDPRGCLYRVDSDRIVSATLGGIGIANGLCWSPDGQTVYYSDSAEGEIYRAGYDVRSGVFSRPQLFARFDSEAPDGAVTDAAGNYWAALWGGGRVVCLDPVGGQVTELSLETPQPACVGFGGAHLDILFVTSASVGLSPARDGLAGSLIVYQTRTKGIAAKPYKGARD